MPGAGDQHFLPLDLPLQNNHDEVGSFREIHKSGKKDEEFSFLKFRRPFATARVLYL